MINSEQRRTLLLGSLVFTALGILSLLFYLERTVFIDMAFHTVVLLKKKALFIQNQRFVAAFTQMFPLAAAAMGWSLKNVMAFYSFGFVALQALVFFLCVGWLKQWKMGLVVILSATLMVTDTFYWVQSELPQGMAVLLLATALMLHGGSVGLNGFKLGLLFVLWITVLYAHPMLAFPGMFIWFFFYDRRSEQPLANPSLVLGSAVFSVLFLIIKNKLLGPSGYDSEAMSRIKNLQSLFPNYFDLASNRIFLSWCLNAYYFLAIGLMLVLYANIRQRQWYKLSITTAAFFGYLLLINVSFPNGFHRFYIENLYLPLSIFVAIPLVFDAIPFFVKSWSPLYRNLDWKKNQTGVPYLASWNTGAFLVLGAAIAIRIGHIGLAHKPWTDRLSWERQFLMETGQLERPKMIIPESNAPMDKILLSWGSAFEFILLSSIDDPDKTRLIMIDEDPKRMQWAAGNPRSIITEWEVWNYAELPKQYFNPQDTSTVYDIRQ